MVPLLPMSATSAKAVSGQRLLMFDFTVSVGIVVALLWYLAGKVGKRGREEKSAGSNGDVWSAIVDHKIRERGEREV